MLWFKSVLGLNFIFFRFWVWICLETKDVTDEAARLDKSPTNIQENTSLLRELVDRHAKELTKLNKRLGSLAK